MGPTSDIGKKNRSANTSPQGNHPAGHSLKNRFLFPAVVLLIVALGFNALLSLTSLEKLYTDTTIAQYQLIAKDLKRNLETALRFGKSIRKFVGIKKILEDTRDHIIGQASIADYQTKSYSDVQSMFNVAVALPDGQVLYSADESRVGTVLPIQEPGDDPGTAEEKDNSAERQYVKVDRTYYITQPVMGGMKKERVATIVVTFDDSQIKPLLNKLLQRNVLFITLLFIACSLFIFFTSSRMRASDELAGAGLKKKDGGSIVCHNRQCPVYFFRCKYLFH